MTPRRSQWRGPYHPYESIDRDGRHWDLVMALGHDPNLTSDVEHGDSAERSEEPAPVPEDIEVQLEQALETADKL